jgi:hypothetical protein
VASAVTVHAGHVAGGGVPHGAVEVVAGALTIEHARGGVVEEARGKVGNAKHLHNIASWAAVRMPVKCHILCPSQCPSIPILPASLAQLHTSASFIPDAQLCHDIMTVTFLLCKKCQHDRLCDGQLSVQI